jgi:hypothetical protein
MLTPAEICLANFPQKWRYLQGPFLTPTVAKPGFIGLAYIQRPDPNKADNLLPAEWDLAWCTPDKKNSFKYHIRHSLAFDSQVVDLLIQLAAAKKK